MRLFRRSGERSSGADEGKREDERREGGGGTEEASCSGDGGDGKEMRMQLDRHKGLPSRCSSIAYDNIQRVAAIGTSDGRIKVIGTLYLLHQGSGGSQ